MTHQQQRPQPTLPSPYPPAPKRSYTPLWIALALILAAVAVALGVWVVPSTTATHTVVYEATADAYTGGGRTGMVTAQTESGTSQGTGALPFSDTLTSFHSGDFVYLSVQNQQPAGSVTCRITVDGVVVSENTSVGGYAIATCQGRVG
jgi:hypothetical protein